MVRLSFENIDNMPEVKETEFGFSGNCGVIRNENDEIVGFFTVLIDEPVLKLQEIEILQKYQNKGYGKDTIRKIFDKYPIIEKIEGLATDTSVEFYLSLGAEFQDTCSDCSYDECFHNSKNSEADKDYDDFVDTCDEYSEDCFVISRTKFQI